MTCSSISTALSICTDSMMNGGDNVRTFPFKKIKKENHNFCYDAANKSYDSHSNL